MKKLILGALALFFGFALRAQTLTIVNMTCNDIMFYSGTVWNGIDGYGFGSETSGVAVVPAGSLVVPTTITYDIDPAAPNPLPGYTGGAAAGTVSFDGFKYKLYNGPTYVGYGYTGVLPPPGYIYAPPIINVGTCPCSNVLWSGLPANPTVYFLP
jgi:hypothetical protein